MRQTRNGSGLGGLAVLFLAARILAPSAKCLTTSGAMIKKPVVPKIVMEENSWMTSKLMVGIAKIILEEHLGYEVTLNKVFSTRGFYRRAAKVEADMQPTDGDALLDFLRRKETFSYINVEAWPFDQELDQKKYQVTAELVDPAGSVGYSGQEGIYIPSWLQLAPYYAQFWFAFNRGDPRSQFLFQKLNDTTPPEDRLSCAASSTTCCCAHVTSGCNLWCTDTLNGVTTRPDEAAMLPIYHMHGYAAGFMEEILQNNDFHAALEMVEDIPSVVESMVEGDTPFAFYWWTPSTLFTTHRVSKIFLPTTGCGVHHKDPDGLGNWRCDFYSQSVVKVASADLRHVSPPAWSVLTSLEIASTGRLPEAAASDLGWASIEVLLAYAHSLRNSTEWADASEDEIAKEVACRWVQANQFQGAEWSSWAVRDIPWYAEVIQMPTVLGCIAGLIGIFALLVAVFEMLILDQSWISKAKQACKKRQKTEAPRSPTNEHQAGNVSPEPTKTESPKCLVKFSHRNYRVCERNGFVEVQVVREGDLSSPLTVSVKGIDMDAIAGTDYQKTRTELTFAAGESCVPLRVPITNHVLWDVDKTFVLALERPASSKGYTIGKVAQAFIHIEDQYIFPGRGVTEEAPPWKILTTWLRVLYQKHQRNFWKAIACRGYIAFHNTVLMTVIPANLVDYVVQEKSRADVPYDLALFLAPLILPSLWIVRWAEKRFVDWNMVGPTEKWMRDLVFRKFWKMSMESHFMEEARISTWMSAFLRVEEGVTAWSNIYQIAENVMTLLLGILLSLQVVSAGFSQVVRLGMALGLLVLFCMPPVLIYGVMKSGAAVRYRRLISDVEKQHDTLIAQVLWAQQNWPMVHESDPPLLGISTLLVHFQEHNGKYQKTKKQLKLAARDADWISIYAANAQTMVFLIFGIYALAERAHYGQGDLTIGSFYALLKIISLLGVATKQVAQEMNEFQNAAAVLALLGGLLNDTDRKIDMKALGDGDSSGKPTAVCDRIRASIQETAETRSLSLRDVNFAYLERNILQGINVDIPMGSSVALQGPPGSGKLTLLRLLSGNLVPNQGTVTKPPDLKVALLDGSSNFFRGASVMDNVMLGMPSDTVSATDAINLLMVLGLFDYEHKQTQSAAEADKASHPVLSRKASVNMNRARALIGRTESQQGTNEQRSNKSTVMQNAMLVFDEGAKTSQAKDHATRREQLLVQLARCLLVDPDMLFINFQQMPPDPRTEIVIAVLNLWLRCPDLTHFTTSLQQLVLEGFAEASPSARLRMVQDEYGKFAAANPNKGFVMLVSAAHVKGKKTPDACATAPHFSHVVNLNRSDCEVHVVTSQVMTI